MVEVKRSASLLAIVSAIFLCVAIVAICRDDSAGPTPLDMVSMPFYERPDERRLRAEVRVNFIFSG